MLPLEKEGKKRQILTDIKTIVEDIIKTGISIRKKGPKERNLIDIENDFVCFKCGKKGHTSKYCNFRRKINKLGVTVN